MTTRVIGYCSLLVEQIDHVVYDRLIDGVVVFLTALKIQQPFQGTFQFCPLFYLPIPRSLCDCRISGNLGLLCPQQIGEISVVFLLFLKLFL